MRNRAKCRLCGDIIESFHRTDYVRCSCGEIGIDGGDHQYLCETKHWENFLRVDDSDKVIELKTVEFNGILAKNVEDESQNTKPTKEELLGMLDHMITNIENMPEHAMTAPLTHYDGFSMLTLMSALFRSQN